MCHIQWLLCKYVLRKERIERRIHGYRMWLSLWTGGISWPLYIFGTREEDHVHLLRPLLSPGDRVLDIGANIGYYALMEAALIADRGLVHAVEPDPRNLALLRDNITLNDFADRIRVHPFAISNRTGCRDLGCHHHSNLNVILPEGGGCMAGHEDVVQVETVDIYDFLQTIGTMDLLRMDLEGQEVEILEGIVRVCRERLDLAPVRIIFEAHPWAYDDVRDLRVHLRVLAGYGYTVQALSTNDEDKASLMQLGYQYTNITVSDFHRRGIYHDLPLEDALHFICEDGLIRTVLLERNQGLCPQ